MQFESKPALPWKLKRTTKTIILLHENDFIFLVSKKKNNLRMMFVIGNMARNFQPRTSPTSSVSVLHNLMDARWWRNKAIEMHVCNFSMGLKKLKFGKNNLKVIKQLIHG